jgi:peptidoglycan/LPS O-acetylase OafA/YrhL
MAMRSTPTNTVTAAALIGLGLAIAAMGIYVGEVDDAPGAALMGLLLMIGAVGLGVQAARNRLPAWAARTALAVGLLVAAFAAFLTHAVTVTAPLSAQPRDVSSVVELPPPPYAAAIARAGDDPRRGRRLMRMRDLACCAGTLASYSTPSGLVRVGLANGGSINGALAGGMVAAHANTSALAMTIGEAFATEPR